MGKKVSVQTPSPQPSRHEPEVRYFVSLSDIVAAVLEESNIPVELRQTFWAVVSKVVPTTNIQDPKQFALWVEYITLMVRMGIPPKALSFDILGQLENLKFYSNVQLLKAKDGFLWRILNPTGAVKRSLVQRLLGR